MKITIRSIGSVLGLSIAACISVAVADEPGAAEPAKPEPPKITHENLYQMEELVKQGADPNAHYFLFDGLP